MGWFVHTINSSHIILQLCNSIDTYVCFRQGINEFFSKSGKLLFNLEVIPCYCSCSNIVNVQLKTLECCVSLPNVEDIYVQSQKVNFVVVFNKT